MDDDCSSCQGVGSTRWDVFPQCYMCTKGIVSALFLSQQAEELRDTSAVVMLLFLLAASDVLFSECGQGCPFLLQCAVERRHQYKRKVQSPLQMLNCQLQGPASLAAVEVMDAFNNMLL